MPGREELDESIVFILLTLRIGPENNLFLSKVMFNYFLITNTAS